MQPIDLSLTRDYSTDFDRIVAGLFPGYDGPPYAFARFADGELALMIGRPHRAKSDHWMYSGGNASPLAAPLYDALNCTLPGWHIGISCPCHQREDCRQLQNLMKLPHRFSQPLPPDRLARITFATLFVGQNYFRFRDLSLNLDSLCVVSHQNASGQQFTVPQSGIEPPWLDWSPLVDALMDVRKPIIVAAGPLANCIIHEYWRRMAAQNFEGAQVIIDIGSAADKLLRGRMTRRYHDPAKSESRQFCRWIEIDLPPDYQDQDREQSS